MLMKIYIVIKDENDLRLGRQKIDAISYLVKTCGCDLTVSCEGKGPLLIRELEERNIEHRAAGVVISADVTHPVSHV